jgi:hypothetical protein
VNHEISTDLSNAFRSTLGQLWKYDEDEVAMVKTEQDGEVLTVVIVAHGKTAGLLARAMDKAMDRWDKRLRAKK